MQPYSPSRRTALVLTGTGAHGAYHAGVLRALQEAGVKIDLVAGQGVGVGGAALAAIDGAARLWDSEGIWRSREVRRLYTWRWPLRAAAWLGLVLGAILLVPVAVLLAGLLVYLAGFVLEMLRVEAGRTLVSSYSSWLQLAFSDQGLPTSVPRLAVIALALGACGLGAFEPADGPFARLGPPDACAHDQHCASEPGNDAQRGRRR